MDPIAFEIFGFQIRWYGIFIATGLLLATLLILQRSKKLGFEEDTIIDLVIVCMPSAIIGARLYYVLFNWSYYQGDIMKMINIRGGGLAIHGGVLAGVLAGWIYTRIKKLDFTKLIDICAPGLILGQAIGRWGNFFNNEAHGGPTDLPWGIMVEGQKVHPTFFYEFVWNLFVLGVLLKHRDNKKFDGEVFLLYMGMYSIGRFFIEGMRTDSLMLGPLRMAQVISIAFIVLGFGSIWYIRKRIKDTKTEN